MNTTPPATPFLEAATELVPGAPALLGIPYDATACFRKGTKDGPDALREVSDGIESYSPRLDRDLADRPFADLGNLVLPGDAPEDVAHAAGEACRELLTAGAIPFLLGGEHSFTPGPVLATLAHHPGLVVVQLDAHADLRREWTGGKWSHACAMRRCLDQLAPHRMIQCGIRSGTRDEFEEMRTADRLVPATPRALSGALATCRDTPLYLTLDLDIFDPSVLPGTGTPEPGGIDWATFEELLEVIPWDQVVACDVVELSPALDPTGCSSVLAAKVVREILLALPRG